MSERDREIRRRRKRKKEARKARIRALIAQTKPKAKPAVSVPKPPEVVEAVSEKPEKKVTRKKMPTGEAKHPRPKKKTASAEEKK